MTALIIGGCFLAWWSTAAALFADTQHQKGISVKTQSEMFRDDMAVCFVLAALPVTWIIAPFLTGFWQHGWNWTFSRRPDDPQRREREFGEWRR